MRCYRRSTGAATGASCGVSPDRSEIRKVIRLTTIPTRRRRRRFWKLPKILGRSLSPGFSGQAIEFLHILRIGIVQALLSELGKKLVTRRVPELAVAEAELGP
jgi:hypothetical protein